MELDTNHAVLSSYRSQNAEEETGLWTDIRKEKKQALSKLYYLYHQPLLQYGKRIVSNEEFVKDCIQELFLTIWDRKKYINDAWSVKSYLLSSLRRTIFRRLKKQRALYERNKKYIDSYFQYALNIEELIVHYETESEYKMQLEKAIARLGKRQKEAIYLKYYDGLSNNEIAKVMGINRQSVYNHVSEAIQRLHSDLSC